MKERVEVATNGRDGLEGKRTKERKYDVKEVSRNEWEGGRDDRRKM